MAEEAYARFCCHEFSNKGNKQRLEVAQINIKGAGIEEVKMSEVHAEGGAKGAHELQPERPTTALQATVPQYNTVQRNTVRRKDYELKKQDSSPRRGLGVTFCW